MAAVRTRNLLPIVLASFAAVATPQPARAQAWSQRGFVEGRVFVFPQEAVNDPTRTIADGLAREEVFFKPAPWIQIAAGLDARGNSHDQVADSWRLDFDDRGARRPRLSVRRLAATITHGPFTLDVGKQFIRWGKTDIVAPTDRFAPRDFLNVVDAEFLPVAGVRGVVQHGNETIEAVWVPQLTPSRVPLFDQRWTVLPNNPTLIAVVDGGSEVPNGSQAGVRYAHVGAAAEFALSFYDGFNHLPNIDGRPALLPARIELVRVYPKLREYGADAALPTRWFTLKAEAAYFTSTSADTDEFVLYVVQLERQSGEWLFVGGYAGEAVTARRSTLTFAPDRGMTRSLVGRAAYTIDPRRSLAIEGALRQTGDGAYLKAEYSETRGDHVRVTLSGVFIGGHENDFLGQYHRNSHVLAALRYSF